MGLIDKASRRIPGSWLAVAAYARSRSIFIRRCTDPLADLLRFRDLTIRTGPAAGLLFNTGGSYLNYLAGGEYAEEADVQVALAALLAPGMVFYDIGANLGIYTIMAARLVGPLGDVVSFEPVPRNLDIVQHNSRANRFSNVTVLPYALGATDGRARFLVSARHDWGMLSNSEQRPNAYTGEITVDVRGLDSLLDRHELKPPEVAKMDIEGGEVAALAGADNLLATHRPILVIELHETAEAVAGVLARHDYKCSLFGSRVPMEQVSGNFHAVAIPSERENCLKLLEHFRDPGFPRCDRCRADVRPFQGRVLYHVN
jgi:FkbM family methyltransferase